jgi:PAS domain S-box-containing protein
MSITNGEGGNSQSAHVAGDAAVSRESILCTDELNRRPSRPPDYKTENRALVALAQALADSPQTILQRLADTILQVLQCGSAGVSLLTANDGGKRFYWPAISGQWKPHIGGGTPRDFGPCGDVLDRNCPLMFRHIERLYTYFEPVTPPVEECLLVPFYVEGKAVGTIWAVAHDHSRKFDAEDMRHLVSLGQFASAAYQAVTSLNTKAQLAAIVESSDDAIISKDFNGVIQSWNLGAERLFGYTAQEAIGQPVTILFPPDRLDEEPGILERVRHGEQIDHFETVRRRKDGTLVDISLSISPIIDAHGKIVGASKIARDITDRKCAEQALRLSHASLENMVEQRTVALRKLSTSLLRSQDEERRKISRELHDSIGQYLAAAKMSLAALERPDATEKESRSFLNAMDTLDTCVAETRTISSLLHPPLLDELGLGTAVTWYLEGYSERSGIQVNFKSPELNRLPAALELALFRVLQESLTNIHRHARSGSVDVQLELVPDAVRLQVRDHGQGIPPELLEKFRFDGTGVGVGLRSIRERISELGGRFEIESDKNGTLIRVTAPLSA